MTTQIAPIAISLREQAAAYPMSAALATAGLVGGLYYGSRLRTDATPPYATFSINRVAEEKNSSGVGLVDYEISLTVYVEKDDILASSILGAFHTYWDRITDLESLDPDLATFVLIHPEDSDIGEAEQTDLGVDVIIGVTSWTLRIAEHQQVLGEGIVK